jgi:hypothetical protein
MHLLELLDIPREGKSTAQYVFDYPPSLLALDRSARSGVIRTSRFTHRIYQPSHCGLILRNRQVLGIYIYISIYVPS